MTTLRDEDPDADLLALCEDCGDELLETEPAFPLPDDRWLCASCAVERGGAYDDVIERWIRRPELTDLVDRPR